jgi:hypothetical protein
MLIGSWKGVAVGIGVAVGVRVGVGVLVEVLVGEGIVAVGVGGATGAGKQPASKISKSTTKSVCLMFLENLQDLGSLWILFFFRLHWNFR